MPKKLPPKNIIADIAWIGRLPDKGGPWGRGITETVTSLCREADGYDGEAAEYEKLAKESREKAASRRAFAEQNSKRALREGPKLFSQDDITKALTPPAGKATSEGASA